MTRKCNHNTCARTVSGDSQYCEEHASKKKTFWSWVVAVLSIGGAGGGYTYYKHLHKISDSKQGGSRRLIDLGNPQTWFFR